MAESTSTPRLTSQHLDHFTNKTVLILGKVTQLRGEQATIDADGAVTAHLNRDAHLTVGHAVEIVGKVNQDLSVKVFKATDMGLGIGELFLPFMFALLCAWDV
jgi:replication factor A3